MQKTSFKVLLVDESTFFLTMENKFLGRLPVTTREVYNAEQALAFCREDPPHLIYMAYGLPDRSGADCCRTIKTDPFLEHIPVILICGEDETDQIEACNQAGCDAVVTRPLDRRRFVELARHFLAGIGELRRLCRLRVLVHSTHHTFSASGLDISTGGMFIAAGQNVASGVPLRLELQLPPPASENTLIHCKGNVSWINARGHGPKPYYPAGFGVEFTEMAVADRDVLRGYLAARDQ